ncbi:hypothetical protein D3C71_1176720 [compost metagenome]
MLQMPVQLTCCQGRFLFCRIVKIVNIDPLADVDREERFAWGDVVPAAFFIEQMFAAVDHHDPQIAVAAHGDIGRTALQRHGFPDARARTLGENQ